MLKKDLEKIIEKKRLSLDSKAASFLKVVPETAPIESIFNPLEESVGCFLLELLGPHFSQSYRACQRAKAVALYLTENGLSLNAIDHAIQNVFNYPIQYPDLGFEKWLSGHLLEVLKQLKSKPDLVQKITKVAPPLSSPLASELILETVGRPHEKLSHFDITEALLTAALVPLRQTVGSCFATSMTIAIQTEHLEWFFEECIKLITTGKIKRVVEGQEFNVPLNPSIEPDQTVLLTESKEFTALKDLFKIKFPISFKPPRLLKAFEYTVASMTEFQLDTHRGTVGISLGVAPKIPGGLGFEIKELLEQHLRVLAHEIEKIEIEAQLALDQVNMTNSQMSQAYDQEKVQRLKATGYSYEYHLRSTLEKRDALVEESNQISGFLQKWIDLFSLHLNFYFQEIFDPNLVDMKTFWQDSPAGFRLVFKHGRADPKAWTYIENEKDYLKSLREFFIAIENFLDHEYSSKQMKAILGEVTGLSIRYISSESFIKLALIRLKETNQPFNFINPWCYLSGGTLRSVIHCFTGRVTGLKEITIAPKSAEELLLFLIEFMKECPSRLQEAFAKHPEKGFLMQSPTHAFILRPGLKSFAKLWQDSGFSYTAFRDDFFHPIKNFYKTKILSVEEQNSLIHEFVDETKRAIPKMNVNPLDIQAFAQQLISFSQLSIEEVSGFLHRKLNPLLCKTIPFADTNWPYFWFSFVVNPLSLEIEIWRESFDHEKALPMKEWGNVFEHVPNSWIIFMEALTQYHFSSMEWLKLYPKA